MGVKKEFLIVFGCCIVAFVMGYLSGLHEMKLSLFSPKNSSDLAAWVGALGSVGAVITAVWIMHRQHENSARIEDSKRQNDLEMCLWVAAYTAGATITVIEALEKAKERDLPWLLSNQIDFITQMIEPSLHIPMHQLETPKAIKRVFSAINLAQRLSGSLTVWSRQAAGSEPYISDMRDTIAILKPEAEKIFESIKEGLVQPYRVA